MKAALADVLPAEILHRKKRGFGTPMGAWLKRELAPVLRRLLAPEVVRERGLFEPAVVRRWWPTTRPTASTAPTRCWRC